MEGMHLLKQTLHRVWFVLLLLLPRAEKGLRRQAGGLPGVHVSAGSSTWHTQAVLCVRKAHQ
jgi:hypothetical protein